MAKEMNISQAGHLPVGAAFCRRIGLAKAVNAAVPTEMAIDGGTVVQLMVLDTLSGRSPLYRLEKFAESLDTALLLGRKIPAGAFNDTTLKSLYHSCQCRVVDKVTYSRGRPPKNGKRKVSKIRSILEGDVVERSEEVERIREAAGCFLLLTNTPLEGEMAHSSEDVFAAYKEQHGIERNFGFLKDPLIVNDIFLKRPVLKCWASFC
jgi:hypothetical protein